MLDRKRKVFAFIVLSVCSIGLFSCGVIWGFRYQVLRMGLCFFLAVYTVDVCVGLLLNLKIDICFLKLEDLVLGESDSVPMRSPINIITIFILVVLIALILLSMLAGHHQYWLLMCILLSAFVVTCYISRGVEIARRINSYTGRLEELISKEKCGRVSKEKSGK